MWTQVKDNFDDLNSKLSNFSFAGGNVGLGLAAPNAKFVIGGNQSAISGTDNPW